MLRASDLLQLKVSDVANEQEEKIKKEFPVQQQKTGQGTVVTRIPVCQNALATWINKGGKLSWDYPQ